MSEAEPVRVCLLVDDGEVLEWQRRALDRVATETDAEIAVIASNAAANDRTLPELCRRAIGLREWTLVWAGRAHLGDPHPARESVGVDRLPWADSTDRIECVPETVDGWKNEIPPDVVDEIAADADVAVRFGFGFLVGDVLEAFEHGVLSFHHGDIREYRGKPPGCWEHIHGRNRAGVTLQRIDERIDAGEVVEFEDVSLVGAETYSEVLTRLYDASDGMLARAIERIENNRTDFETVEDLGDVYTFPTGLDAARFLRAELSGRLRPR